MKGERSPNGERISFEAEDADEQAILNGLYETLASADECVVIARKGERLEVYGGEFSETEPLRLRDLLTTILRSMDENEPANAKTMVFIGKGGNA